MILEWNKIKSGLIVLFLMVNLLLGWEIYSSEKEKLIISDSILQDSVDVLRNNGISIEKSTIPYIRPRMTSFVIAPSANGRDTLLKKLMGEEYFINDSNKTAYIENNSSNMIFDEKNGIEYIGEIIIAENNKNIDKIKREAENFVNSLCPERTSVKVNKYEIYKDGNISVTVNQYVDSISIEGTYLNLLINNGTIVSIEGNFIYSPIFQKSNKQYYDPITPMLSIINDGQKGINIERIEPVYSINYNEEEIELKPSWRISTDFSKGLYIIKPAC